MATIQELDIQININSEQLNRELQKVQVQMKAVSKSVSGLDKETSGPLEKLAKGIRKFAGGVSTAYEVAQQVYNVGKDLAQSFAAVEQGAARAQMVFGSYASTIEQSAKQAFSTAGLSASEYLAHANQLGAAFQNAGISTQQSMQMTTGAMQRAADVASAMGISVDDALAAVMGMAGGDFSGMASLGIAMDDASIAAWMLEKGISGNVSAMSQAEKVGLAYQMFMDKTAEKAGAFAQDESLDAALERQGAAWENLKSQLGEIFAPVLEHVTTFITNMLIPAIQAAIPFIGQVAETIGGVFGSIMNGLSALFGEEGGLALASQMFTDFMTTLQTTWETYGQSIIDGISLFVSNIIGTFQKIYDEILVPIIQPFLEELKATWEESLKPMVDKVIEFVAVLIDSALQIYNKFISPIINWLVGALAPVFVGLGNVVGGVINTMLRTISSVVGAIFGVLTGLINFITGVFTGNWSKAWDGVKQIFGGIMGGLVALVKHPINVIIDLINGFIAGINQVRVPDWVPGLGGKGINIPRIPKLASGGIVTATTLAFIGEAGREAVLPLDRNTGWMDDLAAKINGGGQPMQVVVKLGEETILDKIIGGINEQAYMRNASVLSI